MELRIFMCATIHLYYYTFEVGVTNFISNITRGIRARELAARAKRGKRVDTLTVMSHINNCFIVYVDAVGDLANKVDMSVDASC